MKEKPKADWAYENEREGQKSKHPEFVVAVERQGGTSLPHGRKQRDWYEC